MVSEKFVTHVIGLISFVAAVFLLPTMQGLLSSLTGQTGFLLQAMTFTAGYIVATVLGPKILIQIYISSKR